MSKDIQLSNMGEAPGQIYLQRREVPESVANFRNISEADQKKERAIKIAMVVGAILLLIVTAISVGEIAKLSPVARWSHRGGIIRIIYDDLRILAVLPGFFGTAGAIGLAIGAAAVDLERARNGWSKSLTGDGAVEKELFILTTETLEGIHKNYHRRNGGVQPLVRNGLISEDEGRQLSGLLERSHESIIQKASYENRGEPFKTDLQNNPAKYPKYQTILKEIAQFEGEWKALQQAIQHQYSQK